MLTMEAMEGVVDLIASAKAEGYCWQWISASYSWVGSNLARLGLWMNLMLS